MDAVIIEFDVEDDEAGGFCASAQVGAHSLVTQGDTLDELRAMVEDLLSLFSETSGSRVVSYSLVFKPSRAAA